MLGAVTTSYGASGQLPERVIFGPMIKGIVRSSLTLAG